MESEKNKKILIVDDELIIAEHIADALFRGGYKEYAIAMNMTEAINELEINPPDLILTDIAMGNQRAGLELGNIIREKFKIPFIYVTSHKGPEIINQAKHTYPSAYLVKPFKEEDLLIAVELALFTSEVTNKSNEECLLIKDGRVLARIPYGEIKWLEAEGNYTYIHILNNKRKLIRGLLTDLLQQLPEDRFFRVHKSHAVNKTHITSVESTNVVLNDVVVPMGRTYREIVLKQIKA